MENNIHPAKEELKNMKNEELIRELIFAAANIGDLVDSLSLSNPTLHQTLVSELTLVEDGLLVLESNLIPGGDSNLPPQ